MHDRAARSRTNLDHLVVDLVPVDWLRATIGAAAPVLDGRTVDRAAL
jgi:hypothetical protein